MVSVESQHHPGAAEANVHALVPEGDAVLLDQERSEGIADFVCVVGVRDVQAEQDQLLGIGERSDFIFLEGAGDEHIGEDDVGLQEEGVDGPAIQLKSPVCTPHPHGHLGWGGGIVEMRAVLLDKETEVLEEISQCPLLLDSCCSHNVLWEAL